MAGGFTEKEREQIRIALLSAGYKLSAECGITSTQKRILF